MTDEAKPVGAHPARSALTDFVTHIFFTACQFVAVATIAICLDLLIETATAWHLIHSFTLDELSQAHAHGEAWIIILNAFPFVAFKLAAGAILVADISLLGIYVVRHLIEAARGERQ